MNKLRTLTEWSAAVKARDGRCMCCGATTALVAHHLKPKSQYPELKFDIDNGQTLCVDCHKDHHKENPVKGLGVGVIGRVQLKKRIVELEREVNWLRQTHERALSFVEQLNVLKAENEALMATNKKIRILLEAEKEKSKWEKAKASLV